MSAGLSFGALPTFATLSPEQQAEVIRQMQAQAGAGPGDQAPGPISAPPSGLLSQMDPQTTGAIPGQSAQPVAMSEADAQRMERAMASPQDRAALGPAPGSPDQLLYDRGGMGGGGNPFSGSADPYGSRPVPLPPQRPGDDALAASPTTTGALPVSGMNPGLPQGQTVASSKAVSGPQPNQYLPATPADRAMEPTGGRPLAGDFDPLTGQPISGSPRPLGSPQGAVSPSGAAAATAASQGQGAQPGFMERFASGLNNPQLSSLLLNVGMGLMGQRGFGPGVSAGLQSYQTSQTGSIKQQLEQVKFLQEMQGQQDLYGHLTQNLKLDPVSARAAMRNPTLLSDLLAKQKPDRVNLSGNLYDLSKNGGLPGQDNLIGSATAPPAGYRLSADGKSYEYIPGSEADPEIKAKLAAAGRDGSFTLSPGQTRYDEEGKPVTAVPAAPRGLRPGATLYDPVTLKPIVSAPSAKPDGFDTETKLRGEFSKQLGSFADVHDGYGRLIAATKQREANPGATSPASDISLVFGYMKMLDPGSVVREGEYATAKNAAGVPERVLNAYNKAVSGEFLSDTQRKDFLNQASELYGAARHTAEGVADRYRGLAQQYGVSPDRAVYLPEMPTPPKLGQQTAPQQATPAARYQALRQGGLSAADAHTRMLQEGY